MFFAIFMSCLFVCLLIFFVLDPFRIVMHCSALYFIVLYCLVLSCIVGPNLDMRSVIYG